MQNANLMLGLPETAGLTALGVGAVTSGVTAPQGFRAAGVAAGLKASGAPDVALVVNDGPLQSAAGVFTSNRFKAAPVLWSQQVLLGGEVARRRPQLRRRQRLHRPGRASRTPTPPPSTSPTSWAAAPARSRSARPA